MRQMALDLSTRYHCPLTPEERAELFGLWVEQNPVAMSWMEGKALSLAARGVPRVSTKYLVEALRYETGIKPAPCAFWDLDGNRHEFSVNNDHTALLARWLLARHPGLPIERRRSRNDEEAT